MSRIYKEGEKCNNKARFGHYCGIHKLQQLILEKEQPIPERDQSTTIKKLIESIRDGSIIILCYHNIK